MEVCYCYDGSLDGFLTCVFHAYQYREWPLAFHTFDEPATLWEERSVETDREKARRVLAGLSGKVSPQAVILLRHGFLTCLEERELVLFRFLRFCLRHGPKALSALAAPEVAPLLAAVRQAEHEAHLLTGFLRFSDQNGVLVGEIEPKNRVLPLLQPHFCSRFPEAAFLIYDRAHQEALLHRPGQWAIVPAEDFRCAAPGEEERNVRALWRIFFNTVAIEGRRNPRCQRTHLPLRYRHLMTEFSSEEKADASAPAFPHKI